MSIPSDPGFGAIAEPGADSESREFTRTTVRPAMVVFAWAALVPTALVYYFARTSPSTTMVLFAQVVYLAPVVGAFLFTAQSFRVGPEGAERRVWGLIAVAALLLVVGEGYFAWQVVAGVSGLPLPSLYEAAILSAAGVFAAVIVTASGILRLERAVVLRLVFDAIAIISVLYIAAYHFWIRTPGKAVPWGEQALLAGFSVAGVAILGSLGWVLWGMPALPRRRDGMLVVASVAVFAMGLALSPIVWSMDSSVVGSSTSAATVAYDSVFLIGYYLMMIAGLIRLARRQDPWYSTMSRPLNTESTWPSSLLSAVVLVAVALMGRWAYVASIPDEEAALYVAFGTLATICMVARMGVSSFENDSLQTRSTTDPITGAQNHRAFLELAETQINDARRKHKRFAIAVLDLDGFSGVNAIVGHAEGDRVLGSVVRALRIGSGRRGVVFRLSGDEFAVLSDSVSEREQLRFGNELLASVVAARTVEGVPLSASVGVAMGDGASTPDQLLQRAGAATSWAKYHGKGRVVVYDERIVRALGVEDRLRLHEERAHIDIARALAAAADARDPRNFYHSRNVAALSVLLSEEIGLEPARVRKIEVAAMLHDVGRIALPEELLGGPTMSASRERAAREHAALGAQLVESLGIESLPGWIRAHHERWDGTGYPDGLADEAIPFESRIIALSDAYDAMTSGKQSISPLSKSAALQEIDHGMGTRFDPDLAERFIEVVAQMSSLGWSDEWPSE